MFCSKCGSQIHAGNVFCASCGEACDNKTSSSNQGGASGGGQPRPDILGVDYTSSFDKYDIEDNRIWSLFSYIAFLFVVPLAVIPLSKYARFHINQGVILFIFSLCSAVITGIFIAASHWVFLPFSIVFGVLNLACFAGMIYGIINAVNGKAVELPLIGKFRIVT